MLPITVSSYTADILFQINVGIHAYGMDHPDDFEVGETGIAEEWKSLLDFEVGGARNDGNANVENFNREVAAINEVLAWANVELNFPAQSTVERGQTLARVEKKVKSVRIGLKNLADINASFDKDNSGLANSVARYAKCLEDFIVMTEKLASARELAREFPWDSFSDVRAAAEILCCFLQFACCCD